MKVIRNGTFETNSSSTHSVCFNEKNRRNKYTLTQTGYLDVTFDEYYTESDYSEYSTINDKLTFTLTLLACFYYEKKYRGNPLSFTTPFTTKKELQSMPEYQEIVRLVQEKIPNCKGLRFKKYSFDEKGTCMAGMDSHHLQEARTMQEYLKKNQVTLEQLVFSPSIVIRMNYRYGY